MILDLTQSFRSINASGFPLRISVSQEVGFLLRRPLLPLLLIGIVNTEIWYGLAFWGLGPWVAFPALAALALLAGWVSREMPWGTFLVLMMPTMFIGSERHGRPWQWLVYGFIFPPVWIYFVMNMAPPIAAYVVLIWLGRLARLVKVNAVSRESPPLR